MRYAIVGPILLLLSTGAAVHAPHGTQASDSARRCQAKVDKCIALCVRQNPLNVCRSYCRRELVCSLNSRSHASAPAAPRG
jgi:hypothetical protein